MPTASIATSTPKPSVIAITWSTQSASPLFTVSVAPNDLASEEPVRVEVQRDDPRGAVQAGGHHRCQTDRAGADHGDDVAGLDPSVPDADLEAGRQDVGEHHRGLVGDAGGDLVDRVVGERDPHQLGLGAVDEVSEDPADATRALLGQAVGVQALVAVGAGTAGADAGDDHPVADLDGRDGRAGLHDGADALVAEDPTGGDRRDVALEDVQVGAADRGGLGADDDVGRLDDDRVRDVLPSLFAGTVVHECLHGATSSVAGWSTRHRVGSSLLARRRGGRGQRPARRGTGPEVKADHDSSSRSWSWRRTPSSPG